MSKEESEEAQYLNLIKEILSKGTKKHDRTGVGTISRFGAMMRFSLQNNTFPLLTTKKMAIRSILEELLFFVRGETNNDILKEKNVHIWTGNSTREFFDKQGITRREGDLGPVYGFQWRHYGAGYTTCEEDYSNKGIDQLQNVINEIKNNPDSRRLIVISWNPIQLKEMALPPCHLLFQFNVTNGFLNCALYQRSGDVGLGIPFNIASYAMLTYMIAYLTDLQPGEFVHFIADAHIYTNHVDQLSEQILRTPYPFPKLFLRPKVKRNKIEEFEYEDFVIEDYKSHGILKMQMAV